MSVNPSLGKAVVDSSLWNEQSQAAQCVVKDYYYDKKYNCWTCEKPCVFYAKDQKYTYEILKAPTNQNRILCNVCWKELLVINRDIEECELKWKEQKASLVNDTEFLGFWLEQLLSRERYVPYKPNIAIKNMLKKLIEKNA